MDSDKAAAIQRWDNIGAMYAGDGMFSSEDGDYVLYTDHAAALQAARDEIDRLRYEAGLKEETISKSAERTAFALSRAEAAERRVAESHARAEAFCEEMTQANKGYVHELNRAAALERRVSELESDAARYVWLRDNDQFSEPSHSLRKAFESSCGGALDAAIDREMNALAPAKKVD